MIRLRVLGTPRVDAGPLKLRRAAALAAYLAATGRPHSRDHLAGLLWPESSQADARARLRRAVHDLQKLLGEGSLRLEGEQVELAVATDVAEFRRCLADPGATARGLEVYEDDLLQGFSLPDAPEFEEWLGLEREGLRRDLASLLQRAATEAEREGRLEEAVRAARRLLALDPLDEAAHRRLMALYARSGQRGAAQAQFEECRRRLREDLGVDPEPATVHLADALRTGGAEDSPRVPVRSAVRFVESGGLHIAWMEVGLPGEGLDLAVVPGFVSHLEQLWEDPPQAAFLYDLARCARLLLFDKRGIGLSDRVGRAPTLDDTMQDLLAVLDAAGSRRAVVMGLSEGGPAAILAAAARPDRVAGLVLYGTMGRGSRTEDHPWALRPDQYDAWLRALTEGWGGPVNLEAFAPSRAGDPQFREWWARTLRLGSSPGGARQVLEVLRDLDVREAAASVRVPTLVLHRRDDRAIRVGAGRDLASRIPGARFVELPGADHWCWVGDTAPMLHEIRVFLQSFREEEEPERRLAAVAAVQVEARGVPWSQAFREVLDRHRGRVVHLEATGASALFDGPSRAAAFAGDLLARLQAMGLRAGAALHAGECEIRGERVEGPAPEAARRLAARAGPGELLATATVRDLAAGSGLGFGAREDGVYAVDPRAHA